MKIVYVILIAMAALQGCVKVIPPMTDTSDAAKIIYTRMALNLGEFQALRMFDNPRFEMTERSGRLIEHGHFVKQSTSVYVPAGECSGLLTPDTFLGEDDRHAEVFDEQTTTYFHPRLQA